MYAFVVDANVTGYPDDYYISSKWLFEGTVLTYKNVIRRYCTNE